MSDSTQKYSFFEERERLFVGGNNPADEIGEPIKWNPAPENWRGWVKLELPYYNPKNTRPVPTGHQIDAALGTDDDITKDLPCSSRVCRVGGFAAKTSSSPTILHEAENLLYLEEHCPDLRVPRVHAVFAEYRRNFDDETFLNYYVIVDLIPGKACYPDVYNSLPLSAIPTFIRKVGEQLKLLRTVPPPEPAYYGRIHNQGWNYLMQPVKDSGPRGELLGPYNTHEDFVDAIEKSALYFHVTNMDYNKRVEFEVRLNNYFECFQDVMARSQGKTPVLTHMDMQYHNVMVQENEEDESDPHIWIIDWTTMGWMPAYMETTSLLINKRSYAMWYMLQGTTPSHLDTAFFLTGWGEATRNFLM